MLLRRSATTFGAVLGLLTGGALLAAPTQAAILIERTDDLFFSRPGNVEFAVAEGRAGVPGNGDWEVGIGNPSPGGGQAQFNWSGDTPFELAYDSGANELSFTLGSLSPMTFTPDLSSADAIAIRVRGESGNPNAARNGTVTLTDLTFNGHLLDGGTVASSDGVSVLAFSTTGLDSDWTLSGMASVLGGVRSSVAFQIKAGDFTVVPVPAALPLLATGLAALGYVRHRRRQNSATA